MTSSDEEDLALLNWLNLINTDSEYSSHIAGTFNDTSTDNTSNKGKAEHRYLGHPYREDNVCEYSTQVFKELSSDPERFQTFYGMSKDSFDALLENIGPLIRKKDTNYRRAICPEERLLITIRYFTTGSSFRAVSYHFLRGEATVRKIVAETAEAIWRTLQPIYLPEPTTEKWLEVSKRYHELWNLPNCVGSLGAKHIRIKAPAHSGSAYYNYKSFFSMVLLAASDADGMFITINVGEYGRNGDGIAFKESMLGQALTNKSLDLPQPVPLPGEEDESPFPHYFIGNEALPLMENLMRPYPRRSLTDERCIYNYRISRGRKSIECAFGMLVSKFRLLETPLCCKIEKIDVIIKALCVLHNFVHSREGTLTTDAVISSPLTENPHQELCPSRPCNKAIECRNQLCQYFLKPHAVLPGQDQYTV